MMPYGTTGQEKFIQEAWIFNLQATTGMYPLAYFTVPYMAEQTGTIANGIAVSNTAQARIDSHSFLSKYDGIWW